VFSDLSASEVCKIAGLKGLSELSRMTGFSTEHLRSWCTNRPAFFEVVVRGCVDKQRDETKKRVWA